MQLEALKNLTQLRLENKAKALIISATGTGKTYLSAFDVMNFNPKKLLFVVHRLNIAQHALETFRKLFRDIRTFGIYSGNKREIEADFAIVVGGYKSSNSSHLVELLEEKMPTYFIQDAEEILSKDKIRHFNLSNHSIEIKENWFPNKNELILNITSGASCPDKIVDEVIERIKKLALSV